MYGQHYTSGVTQNIIISTIITVKQSTTKYPNLIHHTRPRSMKVLNRLFRPSTNYHSSQSSNCTSGRLPTPDCCLPKTTDNITNSNPQTPTTHRRTHTYLKHQTSTYLQISHMASSTAAAPKDPSPNAQRPLHAHPYLPMTPKNLT